MKIEFDPTVPIYMQIMDEIKRQIISGARAAGERVESVREFAQGMGVNPNTVQRAFAELEREGLMYTERTSGRYITRDGGRIEKLKEESARKLIEAFTGLVIKSGFSKRDISRLIKTFAEETENG
jgi:DNA-binding transcriptional regulator YhcF (GntR family)